MSHSHQSLVNRRGFTALEMLLVVAFVVILLAISVISLRDQPAKNRNAERKNEVNAIADALAVWSFDNSTPFGAISPALPSSATCIGTSALSSGSLTHDLNTDFNGINIVNTIIADNSVKLDKVPDDCVWSVSNNTSEFIIFSLTIDSFNNVLYAGTWPNGIIYRCATSTGCDAAGDWTVSLTNALESTIHSLIFDPVNKVLYAGTGNGGIIYRCATSTGCDAQADWTISWDTTGTQIYSFALDLDNNVLYAGRYPGGIIYRCATSTGCDAQADWTISINSPEINIHSIVYDPVNKILYAGTGDGGIIYRCATSTGCDIDTDWTTSFDTPQTNIHSIIFDSTNNVLYAGTWPNGIIYRCATSTGCDAAGDWAISYDSPATYIYSLVFDSVSNVIYAGTDDGTNVYRCATSTGCDAAGDWAISLSTTGTQIYSFAFDAANNTLYAGAYADGIVYKGVQPYNIDGAYTSLPNSVGLGANFETMNWIETVPSDSGVAIKVRSCDDDACSSVGMVDESIIFSKQWANIDVAINGNDISGGSVTDGDGWVQYQVLLGASSDLIQTPLLDRITINYSSGGSCYNLSFLSPQYLNFIPEDPKNANGQTDTGYTIYKHPTTKEIIIGSPMVENNAGTIEARRK